VAFVQQVLHAVSLMAVDRPKWRDTAWFRQRYEDSQQRTLWLADGDGECDAR
jgi:hypothetical protein